MAVTAAAQGGVLGLACRISEPPQPPPIPVLALGKRGTGPARTPHGASITASLAGRTSNFGDRRSRQTGSVREGYADFGRRPQAALRSATLHCARLAARLR
jgi:hypothetical protein